MENIQQQEAVGLLRAIASEVTAADRRAVAAEAKLNDLRSSEAPQLSVHVDRTKLLAQLGAVEKDLESRHKQTVRAWQTACRRYVTYVRANPESMNVKSPGPRPLMDSRAENVRASIRAFEAVTDDTIRLSRADLEKLFTDAADAVTTMRNQAAAYCGTMALNLAAIVRT